MGPLYVLSLASQQAQWLGQRQQLIAGNVANANTPGFRASDVRPFAANLDAASLQTTNASHLQSTVSAASGIRTTGREAWETTLSGNSVSLEQEMLKAGDVHRAFALNASIVKAFDRLIASSVKG